MAAQAGWYDAGVPGRERWWDGTQWTAHERDAAGAAGPGAPPIAAPGQVFAAGSTAVPGRGAQPDFPPRAAPGAANTLQTAALQGAPMGWYPVPGTADVRWWDGTRWAAFRFREGKPKADAFAVEPPAVGIALGGVFILIGLLQLANYALAQNAATAVAPVFFLFAGVVWILCGFHSLRVRGLPAPQSAAVDAPVLRPMPGDAEGPGAGWYPVSGQVTRWWTGTRWSWYIGTKVGARPGFAGPRGYLVSIIATWVVAAVGAIGVLIGVIGLVVGGVAGPFLGIFGLVFGVLFVGLAALLFGLARSRRYAMLLPTTPPPIR